MTDNTSKVVPINIETGEIALGYTLQSPEQRKVARNIVDYRKLGKESNWVASYHDAIKSVTKGLTLTQAGAVIKLLPYMRFKSEGKLINNGKPLNQTEIQRLFKLGKRRTIQLIAELEDLGIIEVAKEGRSNVFYVSANFHTMGKVTPGVKFTKLYQVKLSDIAANLPLNDLGILYKVMPYFHYSEFYLVDNPNEEDVTQLRHLNREELAEAIGHEPETVSRLLSKLRGKRAILTTKSGNSIRYLCHPDLLYRLKQETEWSRSVRKMFEQHD